MKNFKEVTDFKVLENFIHVTKLSGYGFAIGHTEGVVINKNLKNYVYIALPKGDYLVFENKEAFNENQRIIADKFKKFAELERYKF